jgi:hypothetical protein
MMLRVIGRLLAACGWLASQLVRRLGPLRRFGGRRVVGVLAGLIAVAAVLPLVIGLAQDQPQDVTVEEIRTDAVTHPAGWVRLSGRTVPLAEDPTTLGDTSGDYGVLVDADNTLRAVVVESDERVAEAELTVLTGHLVPTSSTRRWSSPSCRARPKSSVPLRGS